MPARRVLMVRRHHSIAQIPEYGTEQFLTGQMLEALRAVEYELPSFDTEPVDVELADVARSRVEDPSRPRRLGRHLSGQRVRRRSC